jgi:hypothetical protein
MRSFFPANILFPPRSGCDVPSELKEGGFDKMKADLTRNHHQDKADSRPDAGQIEISNAHNLLVDEHGGIENHKKV